MSWCTAAATSPAHRQQISGFNMSLGNPVTSEVDRKMTYDVFLIFRGSDTRIAFIESLYDSLLKKGIRTFVDNNQLTRGGEISSSLVKVIEESRMVTIIFSQQCSLKGSLEDCVKILECIKGRDQFIFPVFYGVDPSVILLPRGMFDYAFAEHGEMFKYDEKKTLKLRLALYKAANLPGIHFKSGCEYEHELVGKIVEEISRKINHTPLHIANHPVGLEYPVRQVISLLGLGSNNRISMVGIYGISGIGKSAIARAVYNYIADQFEGTCFLADVREDFIKHGQRRLREKLLRELGVDSRINTYTAKRLRQRKILLVLDNVDRIQQFLLITACLDWIGRGSKIIITTRDKQLLAQHAVRRVYEVKGLSHKESLELLSWNAFKGHVVDPNFLEISNQIVDCAAGHPLALEVIGSNLFRKGMDEWSSAVYKYKSMPNKDICQILKVSYDDLDEIEKSSLLQIACFFKGESLETVKHLLVAGGSHPEVSINMLIEKSLLKIDDTNCVTMHELIEDMAKEILQQQLRNDCGNHSRLWFYNDTKSNSSSSFSYGWTYDVFVSFQGWDTCPTFIGNLYHSLNIRGINAFIDHWGLGSGKVIAQPIVKAIQESRIAIIIFSQNYASSSFCIDVLFNILECIRGNGQLVWPVFYNVDTSQMHYCRGIFKDALAEHKKRFIDKKDKVLKWRLALHEVVNLSRWHLKSGSENEVEFIRSIVEEVYRRINSTPLHIPNHPVGLEPQVLEAISLLELESIDRVNMVGIYGASGIGKSTIARAVYNYIADQFEGTCFLADVREKSIKQGLVELQKTLLDEVVGDRDINVEDVRTGISIIKRRLQQRKILLVLDDVDKLEQLSMIAGGNDWFCNGSRIIITTRDKHLLVCHGVDKVYEVKRLNHKKALELFSWNALKNHEVDPYILEISNQIVPYACGLPLALEVIGSNLFGKGIDEWRSAMKKYKSMPNKDIIKILKVCYDDLDEEEKQVFLDITCCFKGESLETITHMLDACGLCSEYSIKLLAEKSLLEIDSKNCVTMHDLIQDMAIEIVRQESVIDIGRCSRLWSHDDIIHILEGNMGSDKVEVIILDPPKEIEVHWDGSTFKKMKNLRILIARNTRFSRGPKHLPNSLRVLEWWGYPSQSLPFDFHAQELVILKLHDSFFIRDLPYEMFECLSHMDFTDCDSLRQIPDLSGVPNLMELCLNYCINLIGIDDSVGLLKKLEVLSACKCINLSSFPSVLRLPSLKRLILSGCVSIVNFPEILEENRNDLFVRLDDTAIEELPDSMQKLLGLKYICLSRSRNLRRVPSSILLLPGLESFHAMLCSSFQNFESSKDQGQVEVGSIKSSRDVILSRCNLKDEFFTAYTSYLHHVGTLNLSGNRFTVLPAFIKECQTLRELYLDNCKQLQEIEGIPPNIQHLSARNCISLSLQSSSMLLKQATLETRKYRKFILPGQQVPEWFDYSSDAGSLTFWIRKKFPVMAFCFVLDERFSSLDVKVDLRISGTLELSGTLLIGSQLVTDHIICQQLALWGRKGQLLNHAWNRVDVSQWVPFKEIDITKIKGIGVHINKQEISMEDIQFKDPYHQKRAIEEICYRDNALDLNCFPLMKKQCTMLGRSVGKTSAICLPADETQDSMMAESSTGDTSSDKGTHNVLEDLVAARYLAAANVPLLREFLASHPTMHLSMDKLSPKLLGVACTCLVDLLRFLQTHSSLDMSSSEQAEFATLLHEVRYFGFDGDWVDSMEKIVTQRVPNEALFPENLKHCLREEGKKMPRQMNILPSIKETSGQLPTNHMSETWDPMELEHQMACQEQ